MERQRRPLQIAVYQDVLCPWSYVASARMARLADELGDLIRVVTRPYSTQLAGGPRLGRREQRALLGAVGQAQREPEGRALSPELWLATDAPASTLPAQQALEAARLQGQKPAARLAELMRRAGLEHGVNVCRRDVAFELAAIAGLDVDRFARAYESPRTTHSLLDLQRLAAARGVRAVPTLVLAERWMVRGLRSVDEYRRHVLECCQDRGSFGGLPEDVVH